MRIQKLGSEEKKGNTQIHWFQFAKKPFCIHETLDSNGEYEYDVSSWEKLSPAQSSALRNNVSKIVGMQTGAIVSFS